MNTRKPHAEAVEYLDLELSASKYLTRFIPLLLSGAASLCLAAAWEGTDDFASGISPANWTIVDRNEGQMTVAGAGGHASFLVPVSSRDTQNAFIAWRGTPTAAEDWTVEIRGHNSAFHGEWDCTLQLAVVNAEAYASGRVDAFVVGMQNDTDNAHSPSGVGTSWWHYPSGWEPRTQVGIQSTDFRLRLVYEAAEQRIGAWYNPAATGGAWNLLDSMTLNQMSPGMSAANTFLFAVLGNTDYGPITEGELWADDFTLRASLPPPEEPPAIIVAPASQTRAAGETVTFNVSVAGTAPLGYQWRKNGTNLQDLANRFSGTKSPTLTVSSIEAADAGEYTVVVSNAYGSATSAAARLTVEPEPPLKRNVALLSEGATAAANGEFTWMGTLYSAKRAIDGDPNTMWSGLEGTGTQVLEVTLRQQFWISELHIVEYTSGHTPTEVYVRRGHVDYHDGQGWIRLATFTKQSAGYTNSFTPVLTERVRFTITENVTPWGWLNRVVNIASFEVIGATVVCPLPGLGLSLEGQKAILEVRGEAGQRYTLESRDSLNTGPWEVVSTLTLKACQETYEDQRQLTTGRFYRLRQEP